MRSITSYEVMKQMSQENQPQENKAKAREETIRRCHEEAVKRNAVELYLLNEMRDEERAHFEEHYFECTACADAVEAGQNFITQLRPLPVRPRPFWRQPAAAIAALFVGVAGGQQFVIARLKAPQPTTIIVAHELEKSAEERKPETARTASLTIEVDLPAAAEYPFYLLTINGADHHKKISQVVPAAGSSEARLSVFVPRKSLGAGRFSVDVVGLKSEEAKEGQKLDETFEFAMN